VDPLKGLILGLLQGFLEWLPISSQGNLVLVAITFLEIDPEYALALSVYLHIGTGLAALFYFRRDIAEIILNKNGENRRFLLFLIITTIFTGIVGLPIFLFVELTSLYGEALLVLTGIALVITGIIQIERKRNNTYSTKNLNIYDSFVLGIIQGLAAIPGLSRSGVTTTALLIKGFKGREAFRISFLMSIPAIFGAVFGLSLFEGLPLLDLNILIAIIASFLSALFSINVLLKVASSIQFWKICIVLGFIALFAALPSFM
jgi:undecaprenyl-diphosphatase